MLEARCEVRVRSLVEAPGVGHEERCEIVLVPGGKGVKVRVHDGEQVLTRRRRVESNDAASRRRSLRVDACSGEVE